MTATRSSDLPKVSLGRNIFHAARHYFDRYLGRRRGLFVLATVALVAGLALNWSWLAAAGLAPLLLSVLPCLAMCALGLCMNKMSGRSCSTASGAQKTADSSALGAAPFASEQTPETHISRSAAGIENSVATTPDPQPRSLEERRTTHA